MKDIKKIIHKKMIKVTDKILVKVRRRGINNSDFTIISNNCWAGYVYRRYGISYQTPTVGLYFFAEDYIKLCYDLRKYMEMPITFISYTESKYRDVLLRRKHQNIPIGKLGDIEVLFLHYESEEEAREKWERRVSRINYNNLIFKFSKMNLCTENEIQAFDKLNASKKILFLPMGENKNVKCGIGIRSGESSKEIDDDTSLYSRYANITKMINSSIVCGNYMEGKWGKNDT